MSAPVLELRGADFAHPRGPLVLDGVDLALAPGERVALLGGNGCGKTTLLRVLVGLSRPARGDLLLDGRPVRRDRAGRTSLRSAVQLVLQEPDDQVFAASVRADVSFGPTNQGLGPAELDARVDEAMAAVGVTELADRAPHLLSYGQRKRVALAGVLAMRPRVLLLDEPTAGLDPEATTDLEDTLTALADGGVGVLMATHDVDLAWRWADEVVLMTDGRLERGPAHTLLADPERLRAARLTVPWGATVSRALGRTVLRPGDV